MQEHDFYITSESYGGHYLPTLARTIVTKGGVPNFKGLALGEKLLAFSFSVLLVLKGVILIPRNSMTQGIQLLGLLTETTVNLLLLLDTR